MKKWILCAFMALAVSVSCLASAKHTQRALAEKMIRLHVVANSDSQADQACKLLVRDAVLQRMGRLQAETEVDEALLRTLEQAANDCLREHSMAYTAKAELVWEAYPTRSYDSVSLPAGLWRSLRITLGEGAGHNWWCVVFPALCTAGAEDWQDAARNGGLTDRQIRQITKGNTGVCWKFRLLEWLQGFR